MIVFQVVIKVDAWGERRGSNPRSSGPQPDVLTTTLRPPRCITFAPNQLTDSNTRNAAHTVSRPDDSSEVITGATPSQLQISPFYALKPVRIAIR